jgi:sigma-B regulation protein RsbU (phosphoserine phosphatase)
VRVPRAGGGAVAAELRVVDLRWEETPCRLLSIHDLTGRRRAEHVAAAQEVQRAYLPERTSRRAGLLEMSALNELCEDASGDYYDFLDLDDGRVAAAIGDVTGHGIGPALLMAQARAFLRAFYRGETDVAAAVERTNDALASGLSGGRFMSMLVAVLDPRTGAVRWCNAGHVPARVLRARDGRVERLEPTGIPLGILPGSPCPTGTPFELAPGDVLLLCSDGATEAKRATGEVFGEDRLAGALQRAAGLDADRLVDAVRATLYDWCAGRPLDDDLTLVAVRRTEPADSRPGP